MLYRLKQFRLYVKEVQNALVDLSECEEKVQAEWKDRDVGARTLDKELEEQQNKLARADKLLSKVKKDVKQLKKSRVPVPLAEVSRQVKAML